MNEDEPLRRRITMKHVARSAGVSQSTVSFVLNGVSDTRIGAATRARVIAAAEALGYRPRHPGRPPSTEGPSVVGVLFDEIATSPFAAISVEGLREEAGRHGALVQIAMTGGDPDYEEALLRRWLSDGVTRFVYGAILTREVRPSPLLVPERTVLLNCHDPDGAFASVVPDERRGGETATRALIQAGWRRIGFIEGEPWMEAARQRREGYDAALREAGRPVEQALIRPGNFLPSRGREATLDLMAGAAPPDAIFCASDPMAIGCYEALKELGLRIGTDVGVMGYDDQDIAQHLHPPLSSVLLPHREMGHRCARSLLSDVPLQPRQERLPCPLIERQSHRPTSVP